MSEIWQYIEGDTYTDGRLQQLREFYTDEAIKNLKEYQKLKSYEKYGLPGYRWMMLHSKINWENDMESLNNIDRAIRAGQEIEDE
jgi:hypothetical protein